MYCPFCAGQALFPEEIDDHAWACTECHRAFSVKDHGAQPADHAFEPAPSTAQAYLNHLSKGARDAESLASGHTEKVGSEALQKGGARNGF
nr:hypothetical protein [Corynebacterium tapiri]